MRSELGRNREFSVELPAKAIKQKEYKDENNGYGKTTDHYIEKINVEFLDIYL